MTPLVRPATRSDLPFLIWAMVEASTSHLNRSVWQPILGLPDSEVAEVLGAVATSDRPHWCHIDRFRVVELNGAPVAAASSYDATHEGNDALFGATLELLQNSHMSAEASEAVLHRAAIVDAVTPKPYPGAWGIENVAVTPDHRGQGLVRLLIEAAIADARDRDREHIQIMCLDGNERAERAWERAGFTVRAVYRGREFAHLVGAHGLKLLTRSP